MPGIFASRIGASGDLIEEVKQNVTELRHRVRDADAVFQRRHRGLDGYRVVAPLIVLKLLECYGAEEAMLAAVSKFLLPQRIWSVAGKGAEFNWTARLRDLMDRPRVTLAAAEIWANRGAPHHRRIVRKTKRVLAEYQVLKDLMRANKRGIAPKRARLVQALKRFGVFSAADADVLPSNLHGVTAARRWVHRFRRFWRVSWEKLAVRAASTPGEQGAKVIGKNHI